VRYLNRTYRLLPTAPVAGPYKFDFWAYSEKDKISRGSGLFVSQSGVVCDNHFMLRSGVSGSDTNFPGFPLSLEIPSTTAHVQDTKLTLLA